MIPFTRTGAPARHAILFMLLGALTLAAWLPAAPARAETEAEQRQQLNTLYQRLLANPSDEDLTLAYAKTAVALKDYEAAIPPLERLLLTNPQSPKLRLELGILYGLLGSKDVARGYLQEAKAQGANQPDLVRRADEQLKKL